MKINIEIESNEIDSPIKFADAIIDRCMTPEGFIPELAEQHYRYLKATNEHISVFLNNYEVLK